jgi:hypothetical protein
MASPAPNALDARRKGRAAAADGLAAGDEDDGMADIGLTSMEGAVGADAVAGGTLGDPGDTPPEPALG